MELDRETLQRLWEDHVRFEFATKNTEDTLATMTENAYVNHIPVLVDSLIRALAYRGWKRVRRAATTALSARCENRATGE